jgi:assimilatory nitrate reductase catalytic subunit
MGGREVGGLSNTLAAHMDLENPGHRRIVQEFWSAPRVADRPGLKAVDLFEAVHRGEIKALWIMATNPLVSLPNANRAREALRRCEFVAVSDCIAATDTTALAHVLLPAAAWGEKSGTVTNSDRHISRQRNFVQPAGEAKPDWWIICQVAQRLGFAREFAFTSAAQIFAEHARLSAAQNRGTRAFDIGGLAALSGQEYDDLAPIAWPVPAAATPAAAAPAPAPAAAAPVERPAETLRLFGDGRFYHPDGRARLVPTRPRAPRHALDHEYPLLLNTGRIRDQWHTMTRSGLSARLSAHLPEPFVDMHPADALCFGLGSGGLVRVETRWGHLVARLRCSGEIRRGSLFVPIHWNGTSASDARVGALVSPAVDPVSGEPEFKCTPARVEPFVVSWYGFALSRAQLRTEKMTWWVRGTADQCLRYEIAGRRVPGNWSTWARALLGADAAQDWLDYSDAASGTYRAAYLLDDRLQTCLFISRRPELPSRSWLASLFKKERLSPAERANLLAGRPADPAADSGAVVCSCFAVGRNAIDNAIRSGCVDARAIGKRLKAGTNCGSCVPELNRILTAHAEIREGAAVV